MKSIKKNKPAKIATTANIVKATLYYMKNARYFTLAAFIPSFKGPV